MFTVVPLGGGPAISSGPPGMSSVSTIGGVPGGSPLGTDGAGPAPILAAGPAGGVTFASRRTFSSPASTSVHVHGEVGAAGFRNVNQREVRAMLTDVLGAAPAACRSVFVPYRA